MSKKEERFEKIYSQGNTNGVQIWVDKNTGVQLFSGIPFAVTAAA